MILDGCRIGGSTLTSDRAYDFAPAASSALRARSTIASPPRAISSRPPLGPAGSPAAARSMTRSPFSAPGRALPSTENVSSFTVFSFQMCDWRLVIGSRIAHQRAVSHQSPFTNHQSRFTVFEIPVQYLHPVPEDHALLLSQVSQHGIQVLDPVRHARDVRMRSEERRVG